MVRHTLKICVSVWKSVSDHFGTLCIKGLKLFFRRIEMNWFVMRETGNFNHYLSRGWCKGNYSRFPLKTVGYSMVTKEWLKILSLYTNHLCIIAAMTLMIILWVLMSFVLVIVSFVIVKWFKGSNYCCLYITLK